MKILFLSQSSPLREGGIETRCREVATRLARQGHEVKVLCAKTSPGEASEEVFEGVHLLRKSVVPDWWLKRYPYPHYSTLAAANVLMMFHLRSLLRREKFDVLREDIAPVPVSGLLAFRRLPLRRVAMIHMFPGSWREWTRFYGLFFGTVGHFCEVLMAKGLMRYQKFILAVKGPVGKLNSDSKASHRAEFIPNGVDLGRFGSFPKRERVGDTLRILSIGRLVNTKGQRYLIEAIALLKKSCHDVHLTLVGQGPLKNSLCEQAEKLGLSDLVTFVDSVHFEDMPEYLMGFDVLAMPSIFEGFNIVVLEALASGLPVAVSDIPGFRDIVGQEEAKFFPSGDPAAIAETLASFVAHPEELAELGAKGRDCVQIYHWARCAEAEESAYSAAR